MKLIDDQHHARHRLIGVRVAIARQVLYAGAAIQFAALLEQLVQPLQHADAELAIALDGDDARVRQSLRGVGLELDPLLEVDQVELDFVRAVVERGVGNQGVKQRRLARAGLARDKDMLRGSLAQPQMLQLRGPGPADGDVETRATAGGPVGVRLRHHPLERHFHSTDGASQFARQSHDPAEQFGGGRLVNYEWPPNEIGVGEAEG